MEIKIKINDKQKLNSVKKFLKENSIEIVIDKKQTNGQNKIDSLIQYLDKVSITFPSNYKFSREEANER